MCPDHAGVSAQVAADFTLSESMLGEEGGHLLSKAAVDFQEKFSFLAQPFMGKSGDMPVIEQRILIGNVKGQRGFMKNDVLLHFVFFAFHDIGGVAHDEVCFLPLPERRPPEDVSLEKAGAGVVDQGVVAGHGEGFFGEVAPPGVAMGEGFAEGQGDADRLRRAGNALCVHDLLPDR